MSRSFDRDIQDIKASREVLLTGRNGSWAQLVRESKLHHRTLYLGQGRNDDQHPKGDRTFLAGTRSQHRFLMPEIEHSAYIGTTRFGKTERCIAVNCRRMRKYSTVWIDPPGTMAEKVAVYAQYYNLPFIYDELARTSGIPGYPFLVPSRSSDLELKAAEDRVRVSEAKSILVRTEGKLNTQQNLVIDEGLEDALLLYIFQESTVPPYWLEDCFNRHSDTAQYLRAHCTDFATREKFKYYDALPLRDWEYKCAPAARRLRLMFSGIHLRKRCVSTFDVAAFLNAGGHWILNGRSRGELAREDMSRILGMAILMLIGLGRSGMLTRRVLVIIDEGINADLLDLNIARALAEAGKWGLEFHLIIQNPQGFIDPRIAESIFQNCATQYFFHQVNAEATEFAAKKIGTCHLDPLLLHHVEERIRMVDDGYEAIQTTSTNVSKDDRGTKRTGETHGTIYRPRPKVEVRDTVQHYTALTDQLLLFQQMIARLLFGEYMLLSGSYTSGKPEYSPMLPMPYQGQCGPLMYTRHQTLAQHKLDTYLAVQRESNPAYSTPSIHYPVGRTTTRRSWME